MTSNNKKLQAYAKERGVKLWQVAAALGLSDTAFSRELRFPLSKEREGLIFSTVDNLAKEKAAGND